MNEATVSAAQFDPHPGDNSDEATAREPMAPAGSSAVADLTVDVAASAARVPLGSTVEKTITVRNAGPASATGVDITDVLGVPARVQRVAGGAASCTAEELLRCTLANLPAGATQQIVLVLRPLRPGVMLDAVGVSGAQLDPNYANNVGRAAPHVSTRSTVARIRIVAIRAVANPGQRIGFVITASVAKPTPGLSQSCASRFLRGCGCAPPVGRRAGNRASAGTCTS